MIRSTLTSVSDFMLTYCKKWPGNPDFYDGKSSNVNKTKAFRISEIVSDSGTKHTLCPVMQPMHPKY